MKISRVSHLAAAAVALLAACSRPAQLDEGDGVIYADGKFKVTWSSVTVGDTVVTATSPLTLVCPTDTSLSVKVTERHDDCVVYTSDQPLIDALFNRSVETVTQGRGSLRRHYPYEIWLASAYLDPVASADTISRYFHDGCVSGDKEALPWPVSSDRSAWILAAGELCRVTGDSAAMTETARESARMLDEDFDVGLDQSTRLLNGSQTYLLPQPMLYPEWAEPVDIWQSPCLGTNMIAAAACRETASMLRRCHRQSERFDSLSAGCMQGIAGSFFQPNLGYYSAYSYGYPYRIQLQATDNMAQMIGIVHGVVTPDTAAMIMNSTPVFTTGVPTMFPMPRDYRAVSEEATRPVVQAYWNIAAAKVHDAGALTPGIAWLLGMAATGQRREMTAPGVIALVFRVFAGMQFEHDGIAFAPFVPREFPGTKRIGRFSYRDARLDISVRGYGDSIASFALDGNVTARPFFAGSEKGDHSIEIYLKPSRHYHSGTVNIMEPTFMPVTPDVKWVTNRDALITNFDKRYDYELLIDGAFTTMISSRHYHLFNTTTFTTISFVPVRGSTWTGFSQEPYQFIPDGSRTVVDYEGPQIDLRNLAAGTYVVRFTYRPDSHGSVIARLGYGRGYSQPVLFLPSARTHDRSSAVTVTVGRHRTMILKARDGSLPHIDKIVFTRIS